MRAWRPLLRIARRDALRHRGRSLLVVAMIALPVLGVTTVDVLARTFELSDEEKALRTLGQADAFFVDSGMTSIAQSTGGFSTEESARPSGTPSDLAAVLPPGSRTLTDVSRDGAVTADGRTTRVEQRALDHADPLARGIYRQVSGRAPAGPGEAAVTTALAERLSLESGGQIALQDEPRPRTVVGVVASTSYLDALTVLLPGQPALPPPGSNATARLLVDVPGELTWSLVQAANDRGVFVEALRPVPGAPPEPDYGDDGEALAVLVLVVGMALLEVVLLAGPAFAVGAKRSARQLALVAATGGDPRDVRRTVLGGGLVLGLTGALAGALGGIALAAVAVPLFTRLSADVPGAFEVRPLEVGGIAAVGVGTALLAALLPARAAGRQDVVAALTGRRGTVRSSRGLPVLGVLMTVAGAAVALAGAREREVLVVLAGSALAELGLVATTPALVGAAGRLGPLLPVAPRLALRDAARNRGRTAPAVSAILAAVAGSVAVGTYVASLDQYDRQNHRPSAPHGSAVVALFGDDAEKAPQVAAALERELPAADVVVARSVGGSSDGMVDTGYLALALPERGDCGTDVVCRESSSSSQLSGLVVGDARVLHALTGADDPGLARVLDAGGVVVPREHLSTDGTAEVVVHPPGDVDGTRARAVVLPAAALPEGAFEAAVLSEAAAARLGRPVETAGVLVRTIAVPTEQQQDRASAALQALGVQSAVVVERGYVGDYGVGLLALVVGSALLVLGASGIATGLSAADGRADLSTLASVGATPGMRRRLAGAQSLVVAALGTALGVVAGLVPAVGLIRAINAPVAGVERGEPFPLVVPWESLAVTALVVPAVAALAAMALTRSRMPLVRRLS